MSFKDYINEDLRSPEDLVKILNDYSATITLIKNIKSDDVTHWCDGSIDFAEDFASDFDMNKREFIQFCQEVKLSNKAVAKLL